MANFVSNICKGRVAELYNRVKNNDPANCAFVLIPLETSGLESDAVLVDKDTIADLLSGTTNEQTTIGRKTFTDSDLAAIPAPDDTNDRNDRSLPATTYAAASGNAISAWAIGYDPDTTSGTDANIEFVGKFDKAVTPTGVDIVFNAGVFFRAIGS